MKKLSECVQLLYNELGDDIGKAISYIDKKHRNAWTRTNEKFEQEYKPTEDEKKAAELADEYYHALVIFINEYKENNLIAMPEETTAATVYRKKDLEPWQELLYQEYLSLCNKIGREPIRHKQ